MRSRLNVQDRLAAQVVAVLALVVIVLGAPAGPSYRIAPGTGEAPSAVADDPETPPVFVPSLPGPQSPETAKVPEPPVAIQAPPEAAPSPAVVPSPSETPEQPAASPVPVSPVISASPVPPVPDPVENPPATPVQPAPEAAIPPSLPEPSPPPPEASTFPVSESPDSAVMPVQPLPETAVSPVSPSSETKPEPATPVSESPAETPSSGLAPSPEDRGTAARDESSGAGAGQQPALGREDDGQSPGGMEPVLSPQEEIKELSGAVETPEVSPLPADSAPVETPEAVGGAVEAGSAVPATDEGGFPVSDEPDGPEGEKALEPLSGQAVLEILGEGVYWIGAAENLENSLASLPEAKTLLFLESSPAPAAQVPERLNHLRVETIPAGEADLSPEGAARFVSALSDEAARPVAVAVSAGAWGAAYFKAAYLLAAGKTDMAEVVRAVGPELDAAGDRRDGLVRSITEFDPDEIRRLAGLDPGAP